MKELNMTFFLQGKKQVKRFNFKNFHSLLVGYQIPLIAEETASYLRSADQSELWLRRGANRNTGFLERAAGQPISDRSSWLRNAAPRRRAVRQSRADSQTGQRSGQAPSQ